MGALRILVVWPPHVPSYFNAGHRIVTFQVAGHLRRRADVAHVVALDAGALNTSWKELADTIFEGWDVVAIANDHDAIDGLARTIGYVRELSPRSAIVTFGRLSHESGGFFRQFDLDGIVEDGDNEAGVGAFVDWVRGAAALPLPGVAVRTAGAWLAAGGPGGRLEPDQWSLPDIGEIPYAAYDALYRRDRNAFCGIPLRRELIVPMARGCPVQCAFCDVPQREGIRERRLAVETVVDYIVSSFAALDFEYASMYAPTFTLDPRWVLAFCERLRATGRDYPWKCTTTARHLSRPLIAAMGAAGCRRISIGLETLDAGGQRALPRAKRTNEQSVDDLAAWCRAAGIELNCFVIVGLPGSSPEGDEYTIAYVRRLGARVRPMMYTPFDQITGATSPAEAARYNRQLGDPSAPPETNRRRYAMLFGADAVPTRVGDGIPARGPVAVDA